MLIRTCVCTLYIVLDCILHMSVLVCNIPPTAKVIWRWGRGLESHLAEGSCETVQNV